MSEKGGIFDDEHSITNNFLDITKHLTIDKNDYFTAHIGTVAALVTELVEVTTNHYLEEKAFRDKLNKCQTTTEFKETASDVPNSDELPVRRSSRIQRLTVQSDVKKKVNQKESKQSKNAKLTAVIEKEPNDSPVQSVQVAVPKVKEAAITPDELDSNCVKNKDETAKKVQRRVQKKEEKEDDKNKSDSKKRTYNKKKKLTSVELDKSIDQVICDVINASISDSDPPVDVSTIDDVSAIPSVASDNPLPNVTPASEISVSNTKPNDTESPDCKEKTTEDNNPKPVKLKSRWCRSSELEGVLNTDVNPIPEPIISVMQNSLNEIVSPVVTVEPTEKMETDEQPPQIEDNSMTRTETKAIESPVYEHIDENIYRFTRKKCKSKKQVRRMVCDCTLTKEEQECGILGCKEECLNRLLMIECGSRCPLDKQCSNKKFQKKQYVHAEIFKADKKGWGLRTLEDICREDFLMEFVGEVLNHKEYRQRVKQYAKENVVHSYFMALKTEEILDATIKGNYTRFINHSCDPNCETQKWTVNGELRVGVFAKRSICAGEEFTLDYKFQRYGREAQKCLCGSDICSGYIGGAKQISIDAYSVSKSGTTKKKKGPEDKKRDLDDIALEEEIEKLNTSKGLRNKEETLKLARLMVRADESITRHQLLDIIIKTEEQACLRLFLDYHGLPLIWSWMTDIEDLDLKTKILQVLTLLPISNKTMLLDSKVMSVVEKWVQECNTNKKDDSAENLPIPTLTSPPDENSEPVSKKLKNIEFSDSETDSTGSHNANDNSSETSSITDNFKVEILSGEVLTSGETEPSKDKLSETAIKPKEELVEDPNIHLISNVGAELLSSWKNLKEVFRIPRLEQQKRKEDEMEADHSVLMRTEKKAEKEVTGDQIQVLVTNFSPRFSDKIYENDNPEVDLKAEDHSNNNLLAVHTTSIKRFIKPPSTIEAVKRKLKEEFNPPLESEPSNRAVLLPTPTFLNQPPVNFPSPLNSSVAPCTLLKQPLPQAMYPPPQIVYPQSQVPFLNTATPPPVISHPPTSMPPPTQILPQTSPSLLQPPPTNFPPPGTNLPPPNTNLPPPNTNHPPPNTNLPPPNTNHLPPNTNLPPPNTNIHPPVNAMLPSNPPSYQLPPSSVVPPNMHPPSTHYIPNQPPGNYPPASNHYGNQNQPYYYGPPHQQQQPPLQVVPSSSAQGTYTENVCIQTSASLPLPAVNPLHSQAPSYPSSNSCPIQSITSLPIQSTTSLPMNQPTTYLSTHPITSVPLQTTAYLPADQVAVQPVAPVVVEEPKPVKLPKNWRSATDAEGSVYYYHSVTRLTQWDPPTSDQIEEDSEDEDEDSESEGTESSDTPTYDEPKMPTKHSKRKSKKRKTTKAAADTSVNLPVRPEIAKKIKELFRTKMSSYIVRCLNVYLKPDCKVGRVTNNEDFKYLARKLTHYTMTKELKQCKNVEDLDCNDQVMHKAKDFIKKYMAKYGSVYSRKEKFSPDT